MINILISGVGGPTPIGIAKSLILSKYDVRLIGIDACSFAPGLYRKDIFSATYKVPLANANNYWSVVTKIINKEKIDFAFIVPETEVLQWALKKKITELPCPSLIPNSEIAHFLHDKYQVAQLLEKDKLTPLTRIVSQTNDNKLEELGKKLSYPYWVRINKGAGAKGAFKVKTIDDIKNWISLNSDDSDFIASPYLPGKNFACKLLFADGELIASALGERITYLLPNSSPSKISGMCARGRLFNDKTIVERAVKGVKIIHNSFKEKLNGMFTVDLKGNAEGIPLITEINIRHVSFTHAFSLGGINFPEMTLERFFFNKNLKTKHFKFINQYHFIRGVDNDLAIFLEEDLL